MSNDLPLSAEDVAEIVAILDKSGYRELDLSTSRFRLRVAKGDGADAGFTQEWEWAGGAPAAAASATEDACASDCVGPASQTGSITKSPCWSAILALFKSDDSAGSKRSRT